MQVSRCGHPAWAKKIRSEANHQKANKNTSLPVPPPRLSKAWKLTIPTEHKSIIKFIKKVICKYTARLHYNYEYVTVTIPAYDRIWLYHRHFSINKAILRQTQGSNGWVWHSRPCKARWPHGPPDVWPHRDFGGVLDLMERIVSWPFL